jgi:predicted GNAT superfamily acetyltransferase
MTRSEITIRPLSTIEDCQHFQEVEQLVWETDPRDIVPIHVLITQIKNGGVVLGAFASDGPEETGGMVGILLGWPGLVLDESGGYRLKHCSHMVGVLSEWRGQDLGLRLKMAQRDALLEQGATTWVTWTYDPLQRINASLNINRLGATCNTYLRNVYGVMTDALNAGMPSDRCQVDWHIDSRRVRYALEPHRTDPDWSTVRLEILPTQPAGANQLRRPVAAAAALDGRPVAIPLPDSVSALRDYSLDLLLEWRFFMRTALESAFDAGYLLADCIRLADRGWHYILIPQGSTPFGESDWP